MDALKFHTNIHDNFEFSYSNIKNQNQKLVIFSLQRIKKTKKTKEYEIIITFTVFYVYF